MLLCDSAYNGVGVNDAIYSAKQLQIKQEKKWIKILFWVYNATVDFDGNR